MIGELIRGERVGMAFSLERVPMRMRGVAAQSIARLEARGFAVPAGEECGGGYRLAVVPTIRCRVYDGAPDGWVVIREEGGRLKVSIEDGVYSAGEFLKRLTG